MKIEWNKVTWYSRIIALIMFASLPFAGFYLGVLYQKNLNFGQEATPIKIYSNPCKAGEIALFQGGSFSACTKPTTISNKNSATSSGNTKPTTTKNYTNTCPNDEVALFEGGVFSGCAKPGQ